MRPPRNVPAFRDYLRILAASWGVIVLAALLSGGAGWLVWHNEREVFAYTRFFVVASAGAQPADAQYGNVSALSKTVTFRALAQSTQVADRAIAETGSDQTPAELAERVTVGLTESVFLEMRVSGEDPDETRDIANAMSRSMVALSKQIAAVDTGGTDLVLVDPATGVSDGRAPLYRGMLLGAGLGGGLSAVLVLAVGLIGGLVIDRRQVGHIVEESRQPRSDR